jgi:hypothetical protein
VGHKASSVGEKSEAKNAGGVSQSSAQSVNSQSRLIADTGLAMVAHAGQLGCREQDHKHQPNPVVDSPRGAVWVALAVRMTVAVAVGWHRQRNVESIND